MQIEAGVSVVVPHALFEVAAVLLVPGGALGIGALVGASVPGARGVSLLGLVARVAADL